MQACRFTTCPVRLRPPGGQGLRHRVLHCSSLVGGGVQAASAAHAPMGEPPPAAAGTPSRPGTATQAQLKCSLLAAETYRQLQPTVAQVAAAGGPHLVAATLVRLAHVILGMEGGAYADGAASADPTPWPSSSQGSPGPAADAQEPDSGLADQLLGQLGVAIAALVDQLTLPNLSGILWAWARLGHRADPALLGANPSLLHRLEAQLVRCSVQREVAGEGGAAGGRLLGRGQAAASC